MCISFLSHREAVECETGPERSVFSFWQNSWSDLVTSKDNVYIKRTNGSYQLASIYTVMGFEIRKDAFVVGNDDISVDKRRPVLGVFARWNSNEIEMMKWADLYDSLQYHMVNEIAWPFPTELIIYHDYYSYRPDVPLTAIAERLSRPPRLVVKFQAASHPEECKCPKFIN
jgi:hypothetical protein